MKQFWSYTVMLVPRIVTVGAILWVTVTISVSHWPTATAGEFAQMIAMLAGAVWLSIGILRRRILGFVRRGFYDTKTKDVGWKTVGLVFRWKYDSECHGKLIDVSASTTKKIGKDSTRTDNKRNISIVRQHYLTIACWIWRKPPVNALSRISVCGYTFRIETFVADTPSGTRYSLDLDREPHNFSLADALELQAQLVRLLEIVNRCEMDGYLATANSRELLDKVVLGMSGWRRPFYGSLLYSLRVFLPDRSYPQFDHLTEILREKGSKVVKDAIDRNEDRISQKVALLSPPGRPAP